MRFPPFHRSFCLWQGMNTSLSQPLTAWDLWQRCTSSHHSIGSIARNPCPSAAFICMRRPVSCVLTSHGPLFTSMPLQGIEDQHMFASDVTCRHVYPWSSPVCLGLVICRLFLWCCLSVGLTGQSSWYEKVKGILVMVWETCACVGTCSFFKVPISWNLEFV